MAEFDAPQSRNEAILQNILGADNVLVESQSRIEEILQCILYNEPYSEEALSRMEELLLCILNGTDTDLVAQSRNEAILIAKIKGEEYTEEPQSRIEELLIEWSNVIQSYTGGGLVYNQLLKKRTPTNTLGLTITPNDIGFTIDGTSNASGAIDAYSTFKSYANHVYLIYPYISKPLSFSYLYKNIGGSIALSGATVIKETQDRTGASVTFRTDNNTHWDNVMVSLYTIDLTAFFGSDTIPNYILSLETQQAGSGVAWFRQYFPDAYYPYSTNTLTVVDKNNYKLFGYKNWVLGDAVLRGIATEADGELVWDGDEYQSGVITRKYAEIDLGSRTWSYIAPTTSIPYGCFYITLYYKKAGEENILCPKYVIGNLQKDNCIVGNSGANTVYIVDSSFNGDTDAFKTAMNGIYLIYELASPTHEVVSWNKIRTLVRQGKASEVFTVGDQLEVNVDGVPTAFDIIGIDVDTPYDTTKTHSLTLQMHDCYATYVFDAREALFAFPDGLEAGTYHFTITGDSWVSEDVGKTLQFTIATDIPEGGQLCFSSTYNTTMVGASVQIYASPNDTTAQETVTFTEGSDGTDLGNVNNAINGNTNSLQRAKLGNNRYSQSIHRQILNSATSPYGWESKNPWDRIPSNSTDGLLSRFDADFLAVLGESVQTIALNTECDGGGSEQIHDKVFLLSRRQTLGTMENNIDEGSQYPYYQVSDNLIKYKNDSAQQWGLRTPNSTVAYSVRRISTSGTSGSYYASNSVFIAPAVTII